MRIQAFTLVELLIVVIILGILAAVVVPLFAESTDDTKLNALHQDLTVIRKALQLYHLEHKGVWPEESSFADQLTAGTDVDGNPGVDFGPYLDRIPDNPFITEQDVLMIASRRPNSARVLLEIARRPLFLARQEVQRALVHNPYGSTSVSLKLLPQLSYSELRRLAHAGHLHPLVPRATQVFLTLRDEHFKDLGA